MSGVAELLQQMREQRRNTQAQLRGIVEEQMLAKTHYGRR